MRNLKAVLKRELRGYFESPVAYVFIIIFLLATAGCTFFISRFFDARVASLEMFFFWHPWLYLFLVPAVGMRLWSEERKSGTIELLFTLPITLIEAIAGKFLAAWAFIGIALVLLGAFLASRGAKSPVKDAVVESVEEGLVEGGPGRATATKRGPASNSNE